MRALVVDDSKPSRSIVARTLQELNFSCSEAGNGAEALAALASGGRPDLVTVNWQMPVMDGIEFMKNIVKVPEVALMPIVMITASGSDDNKKHARDVNPNLAGYIVKPYKPDSLLETIKPYLK